MNAYEERKFKRIERYREYRRNAKERADKHADKAQQMIDMIGGQPILIGHHSEKRHRNDINRIDRNFAKAVEEQDKSDYWAHRAEAAESNNTISYKDPEAAEKLKTKIAELERLQESYKAANAKLRAAKITLDDPQHVEKLQALGLSDFLTKEAISCNRYSFTGKDFIILPTWLLSNNNSNLKRYKERLKQMELVAQRLESFEAISTDKGEIVKNEEYNGIEVYFPGKPEQEIIDKLKSHGFKWSGRSKCWYHKYSDYALQAAQEIIQ